MSDIYFKTVTNLLEKRLFSNIDAYKQTTKKKNYFSFHCKSIIVHAPISMLVILGHLFGPNGERGQKNCLLLSSFLKKKINVIRVKYLSKKEKEKFYTLFPSDRLRLMR